MFSSCQWCWKELFLLCTGSILTMRDNLLFLVLRVFCTSSNVKQINFWRNKAQAPDSVGSRIGKSCCLLFSGFIPGSTGICSAEWAVWGGLQFEEQHCEQSSLEWLTKRASGNQPSWVTRSALLQASWECAKTQGCTPILNMRGYCSVTLLSGTNGSHRPSYLGTQTVVWTPSCKAT